MKEVLKKLFCAGLTVFAGAVLFLQMIGETPDLPGRWLSLGTVFLVAAVIWIEYGYIRVLKRRLTELEKQLETEYKNADKLDK